MSDEKPRPDKDPERKGGEKSEKPDSGSMSLADRMKTARQAMDDSADTTMESSPPASMADKLRATQTAAEPPPVKKPVGSTTPKVSPSGGKPTPSVTSETESKPGQTLAGSLGAKLSAAAAAAATLSEEAAAELEQKYAALKNEQRSLLEKVRLTGIVRDTTNLGTQIKGFPDAIAQVRQRGYAFRAYLEDKAEVLSAQWQEIDHEIKKWVDNESQSLQNDIKEAEELVSRVDSHDRRNQGRQALITQLENVIETIKAKADAADEHIRAHYDALRREASVTEKQLNEINWILGEKESSSFDFMVGEAVFVAAKAEWTDGQDKPNGTLFLTDQRIIFEQKETVGKRLGLFGGKDVQKMLWEVPIIGIESIQSENKGLFGGKDMLHLKFNRGGLSGVTLEVKGGADCKFWEKQINRMVRGDAHDERAIEPDPELIERLRNAPTQCHVCGGMLPQIVRGQFEATCQYCGTVIRL